MKLISKDEALKIAKNDTYKLPPTLTYTSVLEAFFAGMAQRQFDIESEIKKLPTVEQKHGHWNVDGECSVCKLPWNHLMTDNAQDWGYFDPMPPYCLNCGAKMDELDEEVE